MADPKKPTSYKLVPSDDGSIDAIPYDAPEEPDPQPEADGNYYLRSGTKAMFLAWDLHERGITVYCAKCRAPLKVSRMYIFCSKDQRHFNVVV